MEEVVELKAHLQSPSHVTHTRRGDFNAPIHPQARHSPEDVGVDFSVRGVSGQGNKGNGGGGGGQG
jgi:hypothetical protein